ncbi:MAG TPA: transglutaminase-like domain-containing protein, partial [Actinomycetota bacterium]
HGTNDMLNFLAARRGYCEQFAGTMAVMLRLLGYPARVAIGFTAGDADEDGVFRVTTEQAHAWVEMYFPLYGWLPFEPTPTRDNPTASHLTAPLPELPGTGQGPDAATQQGGRFQAQDPRLDHVERRFGIGPAARLQLEEEEPTSLWPRIVLGLLLVLLAIGGVPTWKWISRRRRLRRASSPREAVLAAFDVLEERAADVGLERRPEETLLEYEARLRGTITLRDGDLERMTGLVTRAAYGSDDVDAAEARLAADALKILTADLRRHAGRGRALVGAIRPARD